MKYKPGDRVKIRADLRPGEDYGGLKPVLSMCMKRGNVATIKSSEVYNCMLLYHIEGDGCDFLWTEEMFEKIADKEKAGAAMEYKAGDKVRVRKDLSADNYYGGVFCNSDMARKAGKIVTIKHKSLNDRYKIEEDSWDWSWASEMFDGKANSPQKDAANDPVSHPSHYTDGKIEVIDFIQDKHLDFARGNVVKYISRAGKKGGSKEKELEDLKKARQYCDFAIRELEQETEK